MMDLQNDAQVFMDEHGCLFVEDLSEELPPSRLDESPRLLYRGAFFQTRGTSSYLCGKPQDTLQD